MRRTVRKRDDGTWGIWAKGWVNRTHYGDRNVAKDDKAKMDRLEKSNKKAKKRK